jgi:hypothetical protein
MKSVREQDAEYKFWTERLGKVVSIPAELSGSNLGPETGYPG